LVSAIVGIGGGTMTTPFLTYNKVDIKNAIKLKYWVIIAPLKAPNKIVGVSFVKYCH
jgi:uncharacterized membrane protein YfcA